MTIFASIILGFAFVFGVQGWREAREAQRELKRVEGNLETLWRQVNDLHPTPLVHPRSTTRPRAAS